MPELKTYSGPEEFLKETGNFLEETEMQNNIILGNCYAIINEHRNHDDCYFVNALDNGAIEASSIKISAKIVLSSGSREGIEEIFRFYTENNIEFSGVIGHRNSVEIFISLCKAPVLQNRLTLIQGLTKVNDIHLARGVFEPARLSDLPLLKKWTMQFFEEERLLPKRSSDETESFLKNLMKHGNLFSWVHDGKIVSMAAILRRTKNTAIIGLVYTPGMLRGQGFGKSCMHQLSAFILKRGYKESGLLVFDTNTTAKKIYGQIGYETRSELLDVDFE